MHIPLYCKRAQTSSEAYGTWIVCDEADRGPSGPGNLHGVPQLRVVVVELLDIPLGVEVAEPLREHEEVVSMEVHRVGVALQQRRALEHDLH